MEKQLMVVINGVWVEVPSSRADVTPLRVVDNTPAPAPVGSLDGLVAQLSTILAAAPRLSHDDQTRLTNFVLAAGSMMMARTRLPPGDHKIFEAHLREAVARQGR
jgi:hypothetical protein